MKLFMSALFALAFAAGAQAQSQKPKQAQPKKESLHDQMTGQGYGLAGCGLGSIVFGPKPGLIQVVAATLNGTAGSQTFGITTGTSNCDMPEMSMQAAAFIEVNREVVAKEAARGEGEHLNGLANLFQCSDFKLFNDKMKQEYGRVFSPEQNSYDVSRQIMNVIQNDSALAKTCATLG